MSSITRYEPASWANEMNKLIEQAFRGNADTSNIESSQWIPAVDIKEDKNQFIIIADLPGIDKKDINISMENNILSIRGSRNEIKQEENDKFFRVERSRGSFYRRFTLPDTADANKIEAKMQKGVLEISIQKKETAQPRLIKIKSDE